MGMKLSHFLMGTSPQHFDTKLACARDLDVASPPQNRYVNRSVMAGAPWAAATASVDDL
jgi:hypothetical protein